MTGLRGLFVATLTPFDDSNRLNPAALRKHVRFLIDSGVDGLSPCGTTGEFLYMSLGEKVRVIEETVAAAGGRVPVMAGVWALTPKEMALLARASESAGAAAVFLQPPIYYPASDDAIRLHYAQVKESCGLPVFAYNIPGYACNAISFECVERLVGEGIIAGIKDSTGSADQLRTLLERFGDRITVMAASDSFAAESRKLGAHGFISALANVWPKSLVRIWSGDSSLQPVLDSVRTAVKRGGGIPAIKYLAALCGHDFGQARLPDASLSRDTADELARALSEAAKLGLE